MNAATYLYEGIMAFIQEKTLHKVQRYIIKGVLKRSELYNAASALVKKVVKNCGLMRYLVLKAEDTRYLTYQERMTILQVFGHAGQEGRDYLHKIMSRTLNYRTEITEKFIGKMLPKPVSCPRLREQYKELTASLGCECRFKLSSGMYPSPVLHVLNTKEVSDMTPPKKEEPVAQDTPLAVQVTDMVKKIRFAHDF